MAGCCYVAMALWLVTATHREPTCQIYSGLKVVRSCLHWRAAPTIRASVAISVMAGASVAISMVLVLGEQPPPLLVLFLFLLLAFQRLRDLIVHEKIVQLLIWQRQSRCRRLLSRGGQGFQRNSDESAVGTSRSLRRRTRCRSRWCSRSPPTFTRCPSSSGRRCNGTCQGGITPRSRRPPRRGSGLLGCRGLRGLRSQA